MVSCSGPVSLCPTWTRRSSVAFHVESRSEAANGVAGARWILVLHGVVIVDEIVICDKFVFNGLTFLVDNRVEVDSL